MRSTCWCAVCSENVLSGKHTLRHVLTVYWQHTGGILDTGTDTAVPVAGVLMLGQYIAERWG